MKKITLLFLAAIFALHDLNLKAVILFDPNVLLNSKDAWESGARNLEQKYKYRVPEDSSILHGLPLGTTLKSLGFNAQSVQPFFCELYKTVFSQELPTPKGIAELLTQLGNAGHECVVFGTSKEAVTHMVTSIGLMSHFTDVLEARSAMAVDFFKDNGITYNTVSGQADAILDFVAQHPHATLVTQQVDIAHQLINRAKERNIKDFKVIGATWGWSNKAAFEQFAPDVVVAENTDELVALLDQ